ncbi:T9SS type A sorting domain-containing protein, partial [candidate division WOR-3 bacterium]|nr:T9SS type A sorting domain-containing protein [candidate division WOR-3 bacterium]
KNEFYKYSPTEALWTTLPAAPAGANPKWDKGSWVVSDRVGKLYAHKAKHNEFYAYDCERDSWSGPMKPMPLSGSAGSKKAKDGSCAAFMDGNLYAFKGGNTVEFWRYAPGADSWSEQTSIPMIGSTGKKKKIKTGAALAEYQTAAVFAFKGNKCAEFWRFAPAPAAATPGGREGVMAAPAVVGEYRMSIVPNPLSARFADVHLSSPLSTPARLRVYDATGRLVQSAFGVRTSHFRLDLRSLPLGVYLVKLESAGFTASQKLVVQR